jgi:hypothetical protein
VVPLDVEVPVAAGRDLSLCNDSDVDVVVFKKIEQSQFPSAGQNPLRIPCHYVYSFFLSSWPPRRSKRCFDDVFGLYRCCSRSTVSSKIVIASSEVRAVRTMRGGTGAGARSRAGAGAKVGAGATYTGAWACTTWLYETPCDIELSVIKRFRCNDDLN